MRFLNYPGDVVASFERGQAKGPSYVMETWYVNEATYDASTDTTRVSFTLIPPVD